MKYLKVISNRQSGKVLYLRLDSMDKDGTSLFQKFCSTCEMEAVSGKGHFEQIARIRLMLKTLYGGRLKQDPLFADLASLFSEWLIMEHYGVAVEGEDILTDRTASVEEFQFPF